MYVMDSCWWSFKNVFFFLSLALIELGHLNQKLCINFLFEFNKQGRTRKLLQMFAALKHFFLYDFANTLAYIQHTAHVDCRIIAAMVIFAKSEMNKRKAQIEVPKKKKKESRKSVLKIQVLGIIIISYKTTKNHNSFKNILN